MGKTVYQKCKEIHDILLANNIEQVTPARLEPVIKKVAGYGRETIRQYFSAMVDYNFLDNVGVGVFKVLSNVERIELESRTNLKV